MTDLIGDYYIVTSIMSIHVVRFWNDDGDFNKQFFCHPRIEYSWANEKSVTSLKENHFLFIADTWYKACIGKFCQFIFYSAYWELQLVSCLNKQIVANINVAITT